MNNRCASDFATATARSRALFSLMTSILSLPGSCTILSPRAMLCGGDRLEKSSAPTWTTDASSKLGNALPPLMFILRRGPRRWTGLWGGVMTSVCFMTSESATAMSSLVSSILEASASGTSTLSEPSSCILPTPLAMCTGLSLVGLLRADLKGERTAVEGTDLPIRYGGLRSQTGCAEEFIFTNDSPWRPAITDSFIFECASSQSCRQCSFSLYSALSFSRPS